jgi:hypothetical protein
MHRAAGGPIRNVFTLANGLRLVAIGWAVYSYQLAGFWAGVGVMFLLWWANNDSKLEAAKELNARRVAANAPELEGLPDAAAMAYVLEAIDIFNANASADAQGRFSAALREQRASWQLTGQSMPPWATLRLLRKVEAAQPVA